MDRVTRTALALLICTTFIVSIILVSIKESTVNSKHSMCPNLTTSGPQIIVRTKDGNLKIYDRSSPLIFIGGYLMSGTTLVSSMLNAHSAIRCGQEPLVLPRILEMANNWNSSVKEFNRLRQGKVTEEIINDAVAAFILEVVVKHGRPANRLCNEDPSILRYNLLYNLFPKSKFIYVIRDGRAVIHSMISRNIKITGYDLDDFADCLEKWSKHSRILFLECNRLGDELCLKVKYENLVLNPKLEMERILTFLEEPWEEGVLLHEDYTEFNLSKLDQSTDKTMEPMRNKSLSKWVENIPDYVVKNTEYIAPMLSVLGYDPWANPPNYSQPSSYGRTVPPKKDYEKK